jgi:hypothetical protein
LCFAKKGGCGAKFADTDLSIVSQPTGRVENEDIADLKNTILKMSKKRAKVDATLSATRSSGIFTQDMEDWNLPKEGPKAPDAISHQENCPGAPAQTQNAQPTTQRPASSPQATQTQAAPPRRIPPNGLTATIKEVKYFAAQGKLNASVNVRFFGALEGVNQGVKWSCDYAYCWHNSLLKLLQESVGKECHFQISEVDKKRNVTDEWPTHFLYIDDVIYIDGIEYIEGVPAVDIQTGEILAERKTQ